MKQENVLTSAYMQRQIKTIVCIKYKSVKTINPGHDDKVVGLFPESRWRRRFFFTVAAGKAVKIFFKLVMKTAFSTFYRFVDSPSSSFPEPTPVS